VSFQAKQFPDVYERIEKLIEENIPFMIHYHSNITHQPIFVRKYKVFSKLPDAVSKECVEMRRQFKTCDGNKITEEDLIDLYDDALLQMDEEIEAIIQLLEIHGCYENTLLILTTDHEYNWSSSGHPVALMMKVPGFSKGRIISERTWMLDIAPTIFDLLGISIPAWMEGETLLPLIKDERSNLHDRFVHIIRSQKSRLENVTVIKGNYRVVQSPDFVIPPEFFNISRGFRKFEQKAQPSSFNEELLEQLEEEGIRIVNRALGKKEKMKNELEEWMANDSLLKNGSFEKWSSSKLKQPDFFSGGAQVFREEKKVKIGQYSVRITGDNYNFFQDIGNYKDYQGKTLTCFVWVRTAVPNKYRVQIYDGIHSSYSARHSGRGNWQMLQCNHEVNASAKFLTVRIIQAAQTGKTDDIVYVDGALLVKGTWNSFYHYRASKNK
jgi:hypothetical protein